MEDFIPETTYEQYLVNKAVKKRIPLSGTFELLPLCNLNCSMCYIRLTPEEQKSQGKIMTGKEWLDITANAVRNGLVFLLLTGGEPLLHPDFKEIYIGIKKMGVHITINTNGTLINEEIVDLFRKYPPRRINITLYGTSNNKYKEVCGIFDGYTKVINAIKLLKESNIPVKLNATLNKINIDDLHNILKVASSLKTYIEIPYYLFPKNRKLNKEEDTLRLSPKEAAELRFELVKYSLGYDKENIYLDVKKALTTADLSESEYVPVPKGFWCNAGYQAFWVNWKGDVTSCGLLEKPKVNIKSISFEKMWEQLVESTKVIQLSDQCFNCKYCKICSPCAASMYAETGDFQKVPQYRCDLTKEYIKILHDYCDEYNR